MKSFLLPIIAGVLFIVIGFVVGMWLTPLPKLPPAVVTPRPVVAQAPVDALTPDVLKKTSEGLVELSQHLQAKSQELNIREQKIKSREDEIQAEQEALNRAHNKVAELFSQFRSRLQLVEANQVEQLDRQKDMYTAMSSDQAIDLIRAMDDPSMARLFSRMESKSLAKLVAAWEIKYPDDTQRLLRAMDEMGRVMVADQLALPDAATLEASTSTLSDSNSSPMASVSPQDASSPDGTATTPPPDTTATTPPPDATAATSPPDATSASTPSSSAPAASDQQTPSSPTN